jgi:type IV pilus assembly protein PilQ
LSFRRKPESSDKSVFWSPAFAGVTNFTLVTVILVFSPPSLLAQTSAEAAAISSPESSSSASAASGNVSLDFKDADVNNVLRILSLKSGVNIVAGPEVTGTVTIRLENVPWEKALDVVLRTYGYVYERDGNVVRVTTKENVSSEELATETFVLNYTTATEAEEAIKDILSERGRIKSVPRTNMLVVTDISTNLMKVREVIAKLDKSTPQAHVDSKIVKTSLQEGENLGIQWSPGGTLTGAQRPVTFPFNSFAKHDDSDPFERVFSKFFPNFAGATSSTAGSTGTTSSTIANPFNPSSFPLQSAPSISSNTYNLGTLNFSAFQAVLQFLRSRSNTKLVSNPRITVLNNQTAKIKVGIDVALPEFERNEQTGSFEISGYDFRETGVTMEVTPHINDADEILVNLKPEVSAQSGSTTFSASTTASFTSIPNFSVTNAETQVLIKNGETIAIGGLLTDSTAVSESKVPVLGDIPFMGKFFKSKRQAEGTTNQKEETIFFVTVTIVDASGEPTELTAPVPQTANVQGSEAAGVAKVSSTPSNIPVERIG